MFPAVGGGAAYLLAGDGLYALAAADGAIKWHLPKIQGGASGGLLLDGDTVYVASESLDLDAGVAAYSTADGTKRWLTKFNNGPSGAPVLANGTLYVASAGAVRALAASNGKPLWTTLYAPQGTKSSPVVADGLVYIGAEDNALHVLDAASGAPLWRYTAGGQIGGNVAVGGGAVFFTAEDGYFYAVDLATRAPRRPAVKIGYLEDSTPLVNESFVYIGSKKGFLNAFNANTGALAWQAPAGETSDDKSFVKNSAAVNVPPAIDGDTIYAVASGDVATSVYAFSVADGSARWHYDAVDGGFPGHESRPIVSDGQLYYCGNGQTLFALGL
jgi:outer membrane protein assembly factor BamB